MALFDIKFEYNVEDYVNIEAEDEEQARQFAKEYYMENIEEPGVMAGFDVTEVKEV